MTRFIVVVSGKGGVGKTTASINLGVALKNLGKDCTVLDGNFTTPDIGLHLGVPKLPITLHDVLEGKKSVHSAIYTHASGLKVIPADISYNALKRLNLKRLKEVFKELKGTSEIVLIDCGAGLNKEVVSLMKFADEALIITNPELTAVTNALKTIKIAEENNITVLGVVLNRVKGIKEEMSISSIEALLDSPVIAIVPETDDVKRALSAKHPLVYCYPRSEASAAFKKLASVLVGHGHEGSIKEKTGLLTSLLLRIGLRK